MCGKHLYNVKGSLIVFNVISFILTEREGKINSHHTQSAGERMLTHIQAAWTFCARKNEKMLNWLGN